MGTILRSKREISGLSGIRAAYTEAFYDDTDVIKAAMDNPMLDGLSAIRNVIVHKAGRVDEEYLSRTKKLDLPKVTLGEILPLDGEFVARLLASAIASSTALIEAVDNWLDQHKSPIQEPHDGEQ
jgi:hypothetical protein